MHYANWHTVTVHVHKSNVLTKYACAKGVCRCAWVCVCLCAHCTRTYSYQKNPSSPAKRQLSHIWQQTCIAMQSEVKDSWINNVLCITILLIWHYWPNYAKYTDVATYIHWIRAWQSWNNHNTCMVWNTVSSVMELLYPTLSNHAYPFLLKGIKAWVTWII